MNSINLNSLGQAIDLNKIQKIENESDLNDINGGTYLENYSNVLISKEKINLTINDKKGINMVTASEGDKEVSNGKEGWFSKITFPVPFNMVNHITQCNECNSPLKYISGIHQYLDRYAHFNNPQGWIETKNQYQCESCQLYHVQTQRKFLFLTASYYELRTSLCDKKEIIKEPKYRKPTIPLYYNKDPNSSYSWNTIPVYWDGNCLVCKGEIYSFEEEAFGCVTGKTSLYGEFICPKCNLLYHAEEHDD